MVFLDEPSTGVDPENRRALWDIISKMKRPDRVILMTTHHLEEAEFLSDDVIILTKGQVNCRGNPESIKTALGVGYRLIINNIRERRTEFYQLMSPYAPYMNISEDKLTDLGEIRLEMKKDTLNITVPILQTLENANISYTIIASTLEDAFINLGEQEDTIEIENHRNNLITEIFKRKFVPSILNKIGALIVRKFFLLFKSLLQIILIVMLITIPAATYYVIVNISYRSANNGRSKTD